MTPKWTLVSGTPKPKVVSTPPITPPKSNVPRTEAEKVEAAKRRKENAAAKRREKKKDREEGRGIPIGTNPLTSEVEYTDAELEFSKALETYRRVRQRPFPTNREVLYVLLTLGYRKVAPPGDKDVESFLSGTSRETVG
jgi:hypothetical protein